MCSSLTEAIGGGEGAVHTDRDVEFTGLFINLLFLPQQPV